MTGYAAFRTNKGLEETGIWLDYGPFRVLTARAGGANKRFAKRLEAVTRPYQRAIKTETMDSVLGEKLIREVYASTVILDWNVKDAETGEWKRGIELPSGEIAGFNEANVLAVLEALPDLFADIQEQSQKAANYRDAVREANSGN